MIKEFSGIHEFLSNFWHSPFVYEGITYPTNEHFFQAMKTLDPKERAWIASAETPGIAKRRGRTCTLRYDWEDIKEQVMLIGLRLKFSQPALRTMLLMTGDQELVEGNWWHDNTWGNCHCPQCSRVGGRNLLGMLLMELRKELQYGTSSDEVAHF